MLAARRRTRATLVLPITALLLAACGGGGGQQPGALVSNGSATAMLLGDWATLDPAKATNTLAFQMVQSVYDRLVDIGPDGKVRPYLAEQWTVQPDSVTFQLRKGVTCADGAALTPTAVAESLRRTAAGKTAGIVGTFGTAGTEVTADEAKSEVAVRLKAPNSDLLAGLAMPWSSIVCPSGLANAEELNTKPSGSGPFTLAESVRGDHYTLKARQGYTWGAGNVSTATPGFPGTLTYKVVSNPSTAANLILTGGLNMAFITGTDFNRVSADQRLFQATKNGLGPEGLLFHQAPGLPGADPAVRRALAMMVEREAFGRAVNFGRGEPATSLYTKDTPCPGPNADLVPKTDPAGAQRVLTEAGYAKGPDGVFAKDGKKLTIRLIAYSQQATGAEYLLDQFKQGGIDVQLKTMEAGAWSDTLSTKGQWDVSNYPFTATWPSAATLTRAFNGTVADGNVGQVQNEEYRKAREVALAAPLETRCGEWHKAEAALLRNVDLVPLQVPKTTWFGNKAEFALQGSGGNIDPLSIRLKG